MNAKQIEKAYNNYKASIGKINSLEKQLLRESYSYNKWLGILSTKSDSLRTIYGNNSEEYANVIGYIVSHPEELDEEIAETFLTHIDFFLSEGYRDYGMTVPVLKLLIPYFESKKDFGRYLDATFYMGISLSDSKDYIGACSYYEKTISVYELPSCCPENYRQFKILCASFFNLLTGCGSMVLPEDKLIEYYNIAHRFWTDPAIDPALIRTKKQKSIISIIRNIIIFACWQMLLHGKEPSDELLSVVREEFGYNEPDSTVKVAPFLSFITLNRLRYHKGELSQAEYEKLLKEYVAENRNTFKSGYTYGSWAFISLFDDELTDETYDVNKLFYTNSAFLYVNVVLQELIAVTEDEALINELTVEVYKYYSLLPPFSGDGTADMLLCTSLKNILHNCTNEKLIIDCIQTLFVHRQISTAIHSEMVGKLCRIFASHLIDSQPGYFVGVYDYKTIEDVRNHREDIINLAYKVGLIHDVGKLSCSNVITLQTRKILDDEFSRIRLHPYEGYKMLKASPVLSEYADSALYHHIFYDGSKGYPAEMKLPETPFKIFIEMVTVSDCIDAMTDTLGRNYAHPKPIDTVIAELSHEVRTRYSEKIISLLVNDRGLVEEISNLIYVERTQVNYNIYKQYVEPTTNYSMLDEKAVIRVSESSLSDIAEINNMEIKEIEKVYNECNPMCFVIMDGYGTIYGSIMCERTSPESLVIRNLFVPGKLRRHGYGSMLLSYTENAARFSGYQNIYMPEVCEGHYDKFGWRNAYTHCELKDYLMKKL